jgi:hypothetical protein
MDKFSGRENEKQMLDKLNRLVEGLNTWEKLAVGKGLTLQRNAAGVALDMNVEGSKRTVNSGEATDCSGGTLVELTSQQGVEDTDVWVVGDDCPVSFQVLSDVQYNLVNMQLIYRTRTVTTDRCGKVVEISAESDPIVITTAEECPS